MILVQRDAQYRFRRRQGVHYRMSRENLPCVAAITPDVCALAARRRGDLVAASIHWGSLVAYPLIGRAMTARRDYYEVLGVPRDADTNTITRVHSAGLPAAATSARRRSS